MDNKTREVDQLELALRLAKKEIDSLNHTLDKKNMLITELKQQIMEIERKHDKNDEI